MFYFILLLIFVFMGFSGGDWYEDSLSREKSYK